MTKRSSGSAISGKAGRSIAALLCTAIFCAFAASGGSWPAKAQDTASGAPSPQEIRLFEGTGFSGQVRSVTLETGKSYAYIARFGDAEASLVRSLQVGASVGVALFRRASFGAQDASCAPTLGSDAEPNLIWTGQTADFLPAKAGNRTMAELADAGKDGYASAILYRRDAGPPPGALLMKRRRSYGRGCGNILRSFNFDRRFFPLEFEVETAEATTPSGCFNLKASGAGKSAVTDMLRSDRIALLQPSDLDQRYGEQERRFQVVLFDDENCSGESVTLQAPFRGDSKTATAADSGERRDILLSSLLFRDRAQSLRIEALDRPGRLLAKKTTPQVPEPTPSAVASKKKDAERAPAEVAASVQQDKPVPKEAPKAVAPTIQPSNAPAAKSLSTQAPAAKTPDPEAKILPQSAAAKEAAPKAALPTAKLDPMTKLPAAAQATPQTAPRAAPTQPVQTQPLAPAGAAAPTQPQLSQVQPPARPAQATLDSEQPPQTQLSQSQAAPRGASPEPVPSDNGETGTEVFTFPVYDVYRLNFCLSTKGQCGEPAANKWCQMKGYERAVAWRKDNNIGGLFPTFLIGDEQICAQYKCDGFAEITCGR